MINIECSVVINRPIEEVFSFMSNVENNPQWVSGVLETKLTSPGPMAAGSTGTDMRQFLGTRIESTWEVTEHEVNVKSGFRITSGPIPLQGTWTFEHVEGGTKVTFIAQGETGGFFRLAEPLVGRIARRQTENDHETLKDLLEAQG